MNPDKISVAITHFNRLALLKECLESIPGASCITEVVVVDDNSTDGSYEELKRWRESHPFPWDLRIFHNRENLDCYRNKRTSVSLCQNNWVLLLDSDNTISIDYISKLLEHEWIPERAMLPVWAHPHFDYRKFEGLCVGKEEASKLAKDTTFLTALNTANYFFFRDYYLNVWNDAVNPHTADSLFQNYNWLASGKKLFFVPGLSYFHRVHEGSHYKKNVHKTGTFHEDLKRKFLYDLCKI